MLTERLLPPSEWGRLSGTLLDPSWQAFSSSDKVLVIEDDGQIVACTALYQQWHAEGTWVHPAYRRRVSVGRRLVKAMRGLFAALHVGEVWMMARTDETAEMCRKMGPSIELSCRHFAVIVETGGRPILWQNQAAKAEGTAWQAQ